MKNAIQSRLGFTLIELLVVVLIIGILSAVALPQYQKAVYKTKYNALKILVQSLVNAKEVYYMANGSYPTRFDELAIDAGGTPSDTTDQIRNFEWGYCDDGGSRGDSVRCYNNSIEMAYMVYTKNAISPYMNSKVCLAYNTDLTSLQNQICKVETQQTKPSSYHNQPSYRGWIY